MYEYVHIEGLVTPLRVHSISTRLCASMDLNVGMHDVRGIRRKHHTHIHHTHTHTHTHENSSNGLDGDSAGSLLSALAALPTLQTVDIRCPWTERWRERERMRARASASERASERVRERGERERERERERVSESERESERESE